MTAMIRQSHLRHANAKSIPKGVCHLCLADRPGCAWEDFSDNAYWQETINTETPFSRQPHLLNLDHETENPGNFFSYDLFHAWNLGAGKQFLASCLILTLPQFEGNNVPDKFWRMTEDFLAFCRSRKHKPYLRKITKEILNWETTMHFPNGGWSKGHTTVILHRWFLDFCRRHPDFVAGDEILCLAHKAAEQMHFFLENVYKQPLWIYGPDACRIATHGRRFLKTQQKAAVSAHEKGRALFLFMPNLHRLDHLFRTMHDHGATCGVALNPLVWATQADEDFISRPSRLSRRVSPRLIVQRTLDRALLACYAKYVEQGLLIL